MRHPRPLRLAKVVQTQDALVPAGTLSSLLHPMSERDILKERGPAHAERTRGPWGGLLMLSRVESWVESDLDHSAGGAGKSMAVLFTWLK